MPSIPRTLNVVARKPLAAVATVVLATPAVDAAFVASVTSWNAPAGGSFNDPRNWSPALPGSQDTARFDLAAGYVVSVQQPTSVSRVIVGAGEVSLILDAPLTALSSNVLQPSLVVADVPGSEAALTVGTGAFDGVFGFVGLAPGSSGSLSVGGPRGISDVGVFFSESLLVGTQGAGTISVVDAAIAARRVTLGANSTGVGFGEILGSDAVLTCDEALIIGQFGDGALVLDAGATATTGTCMIAQQPLSTGAVTVNDAATLNIAGALDLGFGGDGTLAIGADATVTCAGDMTMAFTPGTFFPPFLPDSTAVLAVEGASALLSVAGSLHTPIGGLATIDVRDGGHVVVAGDLVLHATDVVISLRPTTAGDIPSIAVAGDTIAVGPPADSVSVTLELPPGLEPRVGQAFALLSASSISAAFAVETPALAQPLTWLVRTIVTPAVAVLEARIVASPDLDGSGLVDAADLGILLASWGPGGFADLDGDGIVGGADLGLLGAAWSP